MAQSTFGQFKLVGKISLWFSLMAAIGLLAVIWITAGESEHYLEQVQNLAATRNNLPVVMLAGGLILGIGTGITIWLITLYSSFRVAGPIYRFSKNLEAGILKGEVPRIPIRDTDKLQGENQLLQDAVSALYQHYENLDQAAEQLLDELDRHYVESGEGACSDSTPEIEKAIARLVSVEQRARCE